MIQGIGTNFNIGYTPYTPVTPVNTSIYDPSYGYKQMISLRINSLYAKVCSQIAKLNQLVNYEGLKPEEKANVQRKIDKLNELLEQIPTLQKIAKGEMDYPSAEQMSEYEKTASEKVISSAEYLTSLIEKLQKRAVASNAASNDDAVDDNSSSPEVSEDAAKKVKEKMANNKTEALNIIQDIYSGTLGNAWYTDYDKIRKGTEKINKDNVADVIVYWEEQITPTKGKSLIKTLFGEEHMWNPSLHGKDQNKLNDNNNANNMDMLWNMTVCLKQKAKELGIYNELAGQFTIAFDELDDTCVDEEAVENALKTIAATVYEKQTEALAEKTQKDIDDKISADEKSKIANKEKEAEETFLADMREIWGDETLEISSKIKYEDGEFSIRIDGEVYTGSSFKALAKAVEDAGYDPKIYLSKQKIDTKA